MVALSNCAPKGVVSVEQVSGSLLHEYMRGKNSGTDNAES